MKGRGSRGLCSEPHRRGVSGGHLSVRRSSNLSILGLFILGSPEFRPPAGGLLGAEWGCVKWPASWTWLRAHHAAETLTFPTQPRCSPFLYSAFLKTVLLRCRDTIQLTSLKCTVQRCWYVPRLGHLPLSLNTPFPFLKTEISVYLTYNTVCI